MAHRIKCAEIWGGIQGDDLDVETSGVRGSLFSRACDGGKGGDIYYLSVCSADALTRVAIADVVGHGAQVSDTSKWLYDTLAEHMDSGDGAAVLSDLNKLAVDRGLSAMTTAVVAAVVRTNRSLLFSYAGHHPVLLKRRDSAAWTPVEAEDSAQASGLPLGVLADRPYQQSAVEVDSGDRLFLYTDGVLEAPDAHGDLFGEARLLAALNETASEDLGGVRSHVHAALATHTSNQLSHDDVTFMAIEVR